MDKRTRNFLDELRGSAPTSVDKHAVIEARAQQVIAAAGHLVGLIDKLYEADQAEELKRRLLASIRDSDGSKFHRKVVQLRERSACPPKK
jgi:hypothetical protein